MTINKEISIHLKNNPAINLKNNNITKNIDISFYLTENGILIFEIVNKGEKYYFEICHEKILKMEKKEKKMKQKNSSIIFYLRDLAFEITSELICEKYIKLKKEIYQSTIERKKKEKNKYYKKYNSKKKNFIEEFGIILNINIFINTKNLLMEYLNR